MCKSLLGEVLALKRAGVVPTFQTVFSARLQESTFTLRREVYYVFIIPF